MSHKITHEYEVSFTDQTKEIVMCGNIEVGPAGELLLQEVHEVGMFVSAARWTTGAIAPGRWSSYRKL